MKKLLIAMSAVATMCAFADTEKPAESAKAEAVEAEVEKSDDAPLFWGFANYGIYSGYQLYGNLVNCEPTLQGYIEGNLNLPLDLGYVGLGAWSNSDLTGRRWQSYHRSFNEWDFNVHYGRTFWFDDDQTWGIDYRFALVWYWYPNHGDHPKTHLTADINNYFSLVNPYITPFLNVIHEYHESKGTVLEFGALHNFQVSDAFSLKPSVTFVWRSREYNWCFPTEGFTNPPANCGLATYKLQLDATYMFTSWFGVFAKVAYCQTLDHSLRERAHRSSGDMYGKFPDFVWGGVGVCFNF